MSRQPEAVEYRGTRTCSECACTWKLDDLSAPNPVNDWCKEPLAWHPDGCLCHSQLYYDAWRGVAA